MRSASRWTDTLRQGSDGRIADTWQESHWTFASEGDARYVVRRLSVSHL
jgi:hypothetical protein